MRRRNHKGVADCDELIADPSIARVGGGAVPDDALKEEIHDEVMQALSSVLGFPVYMRDNVEGLLVGSLSARVYLWLFLYSLSVLLHPYDYSVRRILVGTWIARSGSAVDRHCLTSTTRVTSS